MSLQIGLRTVLVEHLVFVLVHHDKISVKCQYHSQSYTLLYMALSMYCTMYIELTMRVLMSEAVQSTHTRAQ